MDLAASDHGPVAATEIKCLLVDPFAPGMVVAGGDDEEQTLDLDLPAGLQEVAQQSRAQGRQAFEIHVCVWKPSWSGSSSMATGIAHAGADIMSPRSHGWPVVLPSIKPSFGSANKDRGRGLIGASIGSFTSKLGILSR
nr:hypothetical protein [Pararhodobacter aggregans]